MSERDEGVWLHAQCEMTLVELADTSGLPETVLRELVEYGALAPADRSAPEWAFAGDCVSRLRAAARLTRDLELETPTLALVLSFLERIQRLEARVRYLHAVTGPRER